MLAGKTAVVTGASRGIGHAIALNLATHGANVVVNYLQAEDAATSLVNTISKLEKGKALAFKADVSDKNAVEAMFAKAESEFGGVDILVNNAGQIILPQYWRDITSETWETNLRINLSSALYCTQLAVPYMEQRGSGRIVNISSTFGMTGSPFVPAYTASKAALINLTKGLAKHLAPNITVNAVAPGNIDTEMTTSAGEDFVARIIENTPMKRLGKPDEVADAVYFLCSPMSSFITGHILIVDGGFTL